MQLWQFCLLVTARSLYMFRTLFRPSSGVLKTVVAVFSTPDDGRKKRPKHVE